MEGSWERIIDPFNDESGMMSCQKTGMLFTDATHGWLTGDCQGVAPGVLLYRSSDGGATWETVELPDPGPFADMEKACGSYDPYFFGNDAGHIGVRCTDFLADPVAHEYYVFSTADGGNSWTFTPYVGESLYFLSLEVGWALGAEIQHTTDGGATWTVVAEVIWSATVDFVDEQSGWGWRGWVTSWRW